MDGKQFDGLTRAMAATSRTRRGFLGSVVAVAAAAAGALGASAQSCPPGQTRNRKGECRCPAGTDACPDGCFDLKRHITHCGGCDIDCTGGTCRKGECRCPPDLFFCDGRCESPSSPWSCGGCGNDCGPNGTCIFTVDGTGAVVGWSCRSLPGGPCAADTDCAIPNGRCCGGICVANDDPSHCGACGNVCASGEECCFGTCADTQTDPNFCGECYYSCGPFGAICIDGGCTCPSETATCGTECADLASDVNHCGECFQTCVAGASCLNGSCVCPDGSVPCDGSCVPGGCACPGGAAVCADGYCPGPYRANHCGACENVCAGAEHCVCGACQLYCIGNNSCFVGADRCCPGEACVPNGPFSGNHGVCRCPCPAGLTHCYGDACTDLNSDPANCGGCGFDCGGAECIDGSCPQATPVAG